MKHTKKILAIIGLSTIAIQTTFAQSTYRELSTKDKVIGYAKHIKLNNIKRVEYAFNIINNSYNFYWHLICKFTVQIPAKLNFY